MTIGIVAICELKDEKWPMMVFCADRQVTTNIEFDGGTSKIRRLTVNCCAVQSSDDSLLSDSIIRSVRQRLDPQKQFTVNQIANMFSEECAKLKQQNQEKDVISKYNFAVEKLKADPNVVVKDTIRELQFYEYPNFEFIVFGLDQDDEYAHIYKIDQNGDSKCWDSVGFATTGSGGDMAFLAMTKYLYSRQVSLSYAIPRVYFAKRFSERSVGVGSYTDFGIMHFKMDDKTKQMTTDISLPSTQDGFTAYLDQVFDNIEKYEQDEIMKTKEQLDKLMESKPDDTKTGDKK